MTSERLIRASNLGEWFRQQKLTSGRTRLAGHAKSAHGGAIDANCPACIELQSKIEKGK